MRSYLIKKGIRYRESYASHPDLLGRVRPIVRHGTTPILEAPQGEVLQEQIIIEAQDWTTGEMFARQKPLVQMIMNSKDSIEGARALAEKRPPQWQGC